MALVTLPRQYTADINGTPRVGARMRLYNAGTSNVRIAYTSKAYTIELVQPIQSLEGGIFPAVYVNPEGGDYKIVIQDSGGADIYTEDNLSPSIDSITSALIGTTLDSLKRTDAEIDAEVTPVNYAYEVLDPRRYASVADWTAVYNQIDTLAESYPGWYRGDRAQHPALTNCIVGFGAYNDAQMTGTLGYRCTAFGRDALKLNSTSTVAGGSNTAIGYGSQRDSVDVSGNTGVGTFTLAACTGVSSAHNGAFGNSTLEALVTGTQNNGFAYRCLYQLVTGNNNTGMGDVCQQGLLVGNGNTDYGYQAGHSKIAGEFTHAYGYQALFNEQSAVITAITKAASAVVTISTVSTINPFSVGQPVNFIGIAGMTQINSLTGFVTAIGGSSGAWTVTVGIDSSGFSTYTSGGYLCPLGNAVFGYRAGYNISMRGGCTLVGYDVAQAGEPGYGNTFLGFQAGLTVNCNTGSGDGGELNTLAGFWSGRQITSGSQNTCYGQRSGDTLTTGSENTLVGPNAGVDVTTADRCTFVGSSSGDNLNGDVNTGCGYNAGTTAGAQTYTNTSSFGANAIPTASNQVTLGDSNVTTLRCQQTTITALSDARFKKSIKTLWFPDEFFEDLHIVTFEWSIAGMPEGPIVGVIAQELDELQKKYDMEWLGLVDKSNPDRWEATPGKILFLMTVYVQRQAKSLSALTQRVAALEAR